MKKFLIAILFLSAFPSLGMAQTAADVNPTATSSSCADLNYNMGYRARDVNTSGEVSTLQDFLNANGYLSSEPTGFFGLATVKAVKNFQSASGFSPTGYVGALTRGKINSLTCGGSTTETTPVTTTTTTNTVGLPTGCASAIGFSTTTGNSCLPATTIVANSNANLPAGCLSASGFSSTNGNACNGSTPVQPTYLSGCTSTLGWSSTTGKACDWSTKQNPAYPAGCLSTSGFSSVDGKACDGSTPVPPVYLSGCTSTSGWSSTTGRACDGSTRPQLVYLPGCISTSGWSSVTGNACNGTTPPQPTYPSGCTSTSGYSSATGYACNGSGVINPAYPVGCTSTIGYSSLTGARCAALGAPVITNPAPLTDCPSTAGFSSVTGNACDGSKVVAILPDITVLGMSNIRKISPAFVNTDIINFTVDVKNNGSDIVGPFTIAVTTGPSAEYGAVGSYAANIVQGGFKSGEIKSVYINGSYIIASGKNFVGTVTVTADKLGNVVESNENNNTFQQDLTIPALPGTTPVSPTYSLGCTSTSGFSSVDGRACDGSANTQAVGTTCPQGVTINGITYTLSPCSISTSMTDGQGDKNFTATIIASTANSSFGYSTRGYGVGFPTYGILGGGSGGAAGNTSLNLHFSDKVLSSDGSQPHTYSGYLPIHIFQGSETGNDNNFLNLNVNLTVNPAYPAGCSSTSGSSSTTGNACDGSTLTTPVYPAGCTSTSGWSSTTGASCATAQ